MYGDPLFAGASMRTLVLVSTLLFLWSGGLAAQDTTTATSPTDTQPLYRNPEAARLFGTVFPGGGHLYAGEYLNGARYYFGTVSDIGLGAMSLAVSGMSPDKGPAWPLQVSGVVLIGLGVTVWVRGAMDAPRAAMRANAKHKAATRVSVVLRAGENGPERTNVGLAVAW